MLLVVSFCLAFLKPCAFSYLLLSPMQFSLNNRPNYIQTSRLGGYRSSQKQDWLATKMQPMQWATPIYDAVLAVLLEVSSTFDDGIKVAEAKGLLLSLSVVFYFLIDFLPV